MAKSNSRRDVLLGGSALMATAAGGTPMAQAQAPQRPTAPAPAQAQAPAPAPGPAGGTGQRQPNILVIMGDDVGWFNVGAYHQGIMSSRTPNLDRLAAAGLRFTDYYAEASCTAGRANFITGELPIRTGMTTVGQAGADVGLPAQAANASPPSLKVDGLHDRSVRQEPSRRSAINISRLRAWFRRVLWLPVPPRRHVGPILVLFPDRPMVILRNTVGPRNLVHCWATDTDGRFHREMPRWGVVGKQKIVRMKARCRQVPNMDERSQHGRGRGRRPAKSTT